MKKELDGALKQSYEDIQVELYHDGTPKQDLQVGTLVLDEQVIGQIARAGFPRKHVVESLNNDQLNYATTFYHLLRTIKEY